LNQLTLAFQKMLWPRRVTLEQRIMVFSSPHPCLLPLEKEKLSQLFAVHPRLDWWMRMKQTDDFKRKNPRLVERAG
jgi:hypothetical protein